METTQASAGIGLVVRRCDCVGSQVNKESGQIAGMGWTNGGYAAANRTEGRQAGALAGGKRREHPQKTSGYHQKISGHLQASQTGSFERPAPIPILGRPGRLSATATTATRPTNAITTTNIK